MLKVYKSTNPQGSDNTSDIFYHHFFLIWEIQEPLQTNHIENNTNNRTLKEAKMEL